MAAIASGIWTWTRPTPVENASRLEIALPAGAAYAVPLPGRSLALSPDGQVIVYASGGAARRQLYRRDFNRLSVDPIPGTAGAFQPFFSADGRWVAFFTVGGELKKVSLDGGPPATLARGLQNGQWAFGTWRDDDTIMFCLFGPNLGGFRIGRLLGDWTPACGCRSGGVVARRFDGGARAVQFSSDRVFLMDLARRVATPLPLSGRVIESVAWHPDGKQITLGGNALTLFEPDSRREVTLREASRTDPPARNASWTLDGRTVVYQTFDPADSIHALTLDPTGRTVMTGPRRVLPIDSRNFSPALSPDGQLIAYQAQSDAAAGRMDVYVAKFPDGSGRVQVTANGGSRPFWNEKGTELFFVAPSGVLQAASIRAGEKLEVGAPRTLFKVEGLSSFSAWKDGRFLAIKEPPTLPPRRIVVVQHWLDELSRAVPRQ